MKTTLFIMFTSTLLLGCSKSKETAPTAQEETTSKATPKTVNLLEVYQEYEQKKEELDQSKESSVLEQESSFDNYFDAASNLLTAYKRNSISKPKVDIIKKQVAEYKIALESIVSEIQEVRKVQEQLKEVDFLYSKIQNNTNDFEFTPENLSKHEADLKRINTLRIEISNSKNKDLISNNSLSSKVIPESLLQLKEKVGPYLNFINDLNSKKYSLKVVGFMVEKSDHLSAALEHEQKFFESLRDFVDISNFSETEMRKFLTQEAISEVLKISLSAENALNQLKELELQQIEIRKGIKAIKSYGYTLPSKIWELEKDDVQWKPKNVFRIKKTRLINLEASRGIDASGTSLKEWRIGDHIVGINSKYLKENGGSLVVVAPSDFYIYSSIDRRSYSKFYDLFNPLVRSTAFYLFDYSESLSLKKKKEMENIAELLLATYDLVTRYVESNGTIPLNNLL